MVRIITVVLIVLAVQAVVTTRKKHTDNEKSMDFSKDSRQHDLSDTLADANKEIKKVKNKKKGKFRSTSSSSGERRGDSSENSESLGLTDSSGSTSDENNKKKNVPKSSLERTGWRKWHRKCPRCMEDETKKWKDHTIKWICGAYQRARRSFKSLCMMHYRNCQDGTMFVKIRNYRCPNDTSKEQFPHGDHFFYEYAVTLTEESDDSKSSETESGESSDSSD